MNNERVVDFVYCDMDGVIADFEEKMGTLDMDGKTFKMRPGAYLHLPVYPKAIEAIRTLRAIFPDCVKFVSKPPANAPYVYSEKAIWIREHFGDVALNDLIIAMDKSHVGTEKSVIIDDRPHKGGLERFRGKVIHFGREGGDKSRHWATALIDLSDHLKKNW